MKRKYIFGIQLVFLGKSSILPIASNDRISEMVRSSEKMCGTTLIADRFAIEWDRCEISTT